MTSLRAVTRYLSEMEEISTPTAWGEDEDEDELVANMIFSTRVFTTTLRLGRARTSWVRYPVALELREPVGSMLESQFVTPSVPFDVLRSSVHGTPIDLTVSLIV